MAATEVAQTKCCLLLAMLIFLAFLWSASKMVVFVA
jgi:hypothetical protein